MGKISVQDKIETKKGENREIKDFFT